MTRHKGFDVRVSPEVLDGIERSRDAIEEVRFFDAIDRLSRDGTRAPGTRKLKSLDLWEIRFGESRAFFSLVPGTRLLAVGAIATKKSRRLRMSRLRSIEKAVHRWRRELENAG
jgi:hypothetical protein